ncbi:hypothetical protein DJ71_20480 [Halorubrum sp. E3]|nr:hypothetical protein DJ71_20480 [Halorubrum sp. E3]
MPTFDRRDQFEDSDSNLDTVAAEAHRLHESEAFREDVLDALGPVFKQHLDCEAVDAEAEEVLRRWVRKDGMGGLFQIRNQIVSNQHADLEEGDIIRMVSARDGETVIPYVVRTVDPEDTGVSVVRVDPDDGTRRISDLSTGHVKYVDRFDVDRSERGRNPQRVARELAEEIGEEEVDD